MEILSMIQLTLLVLNLFEIYIYVLYYFQHWEDAISWKVILARDADPFICINNSIFYDALDTPGIQQPRYWPDSAGKFRF